MQGGWEKWIIRQASPVRKSCLGLDIEKGGTGCTQWRKGEPRPETEWGVVITGNGESG